MKDLESLFADISQTLAAESPKLPPVARWHPPFSGDIDIVIARNGQWFHEGDAIRRFELVKLFSSILKREGDDYFLVTPVEKWRIRVEDVPFSVTSLDVVEREGVQALVFTTAVGDKVMAGVEHPLRVALNAAGEPSPYVLVRDGMEGLLTRSVFYQLAEHIQPEPEKNKAVQGVYSLGVFFPLE